MRVFDECEVIRRCEVRRGILILVGHALNNSFKSLEGSDRRPVSVSLVHPTVSTNLRASSTGNTLPYYWKPDIVRVCEDQISVSYVTIPICMHFCQTLRLDWFGRKAAQSVAAFELEYDAPRPVCIPPPAAMHTHKQKPNRNQAVVSGWMLAISIDMIKWMRMHHVFVRNLSEYLPQLIIDQGWLLEPPAFFELNICVPTSESKLVPVYMERLVADGHMQLQARGDKRCNDGPWMHAFHRIRQTHTYAKREFDDP